MRDFKSVYRLAPLQQSPSSRYAGSEKRPLSSGRTTLWGDDEREETEQAAATGKGRVGAGSSGMGSLYGVNRPYFHADLAEAVEVAVANAREKERRGNGVV